VSLTPPWVIKGPSGSAREVSMATPSGGAAGRMGEILGVPWRRGSKTEGVA